MKNYLLVMKQSNGCDYTIGCGTKVINFQAEDISTAKTKAWAAYLNDMVFNEEEVEGPIINGEETYITHLIPGDSQFWPETAYLYEIEETVNLDVLTTINKVQQELIDRSKTQKELEERERREFLTWKKAKAES